MNQKVLRTLEYNKTQTYDAEYFSALAPSLDTISEEDARQMVQTMETFYQIMCKQRDSHEQ